MAKIEVNANYHSLDGCDITAKKDAAYVEYRRKWAEWPKTFTEGEFPLFIDVELTSVCNLRCPFCATTYRSERVKKGFMSDEMLIKIIDEGSENGLYGVKFNIRGEPLLHKGISDYVAYAKKRGLIDVYFNTNAMLLDEKMSQRLIDAGLDRISISVEGFTKEVYEKYRVGADFETVIRNIELLQNIKRIRGIDHPKVRVQAVMLPELRHQKREYADHWRGLADEVAYLDYKEMKDRKNGIDYPWACPQLWQRMAIWWDGTILPCNHDDDAVLALGTVGKTTIRDAWKSEKLRSVRTAHRRGQSHMVDACDGCYLRDSEISKLAGQCNMEEGL